MINRDEDGVIISADSVSDVTNALSEIEKTLKKTVKNGIEDMSDNEKHDLVFKMQDLKVLITLVTPEMQKSANPMELISYLKQIMKIKSAAEDFKKLGIDEI